MLEELRNLEYHGGKEGLLFFLCDVIGNKHVTIRDVEVICAHTPGTYYLSVNNLIVFCSTFGWIQFEEDKLSASSDILPFISNRQKMNDYLMSSIVKQLFETKLLDSSMFSYDAVQCCYAFKNERFPLSLSCVRNVLISQGFIYPIRDNQGTRFYIDTHYDTLVAKHCRESHRQVSLEQLKKQLEKNEQAGEKAELFVLSFEKKRIGGPLSDRIKRVSEIDVAAGYDIASFNSGESDNPDRFIEVKALSKEGFYWSKNEYDIAKLLGDKYYLYLIELEKTNNPDYIPEMISNPAKCIMTSENWIVEAQSYIVRRFS